MVVRAAGARSRSCNPSSSVSACEPASNGRPAELPSGKSLNRKRGTPQCSTMSFAQPMITVGIPRSEEHTSELQSRLHLVCRLLLEKKKNNKNKQKTNNSRQ